jgi:hypothetical protein
MTPRLQLTLSTKLPTMTTMKTLLTMTMTMTMTIMLMLSGFSLGFLWQKFVAVQAARVTGRVIDMTRNTLKGCDAVSALSGLAGLVTKDGDNADQRHRGLRCGACGIFSFAVRGWAERVFRASCARDLRCALGFPLRVEKCLLFVMGQGAR